MNLLYVFTPMHGAIALALLVLVSFGIYLHLRNHMSKRVLDALNASNEDADTILRSFAAKENIYYKPIDATVSAQENVYTLCVQIGIHKLEFLKDAGGWHAYSSGRMV